MLVLFKSMHWLGTSSQRPPRVEGQAGSTLPHSRALRTWLGIRSLRWPLEVLDPVTGSRTNPARAFPCHDDRCPQEHGRHAFPRSRAGRRSGVLLVRSGGHRHRAGTMLPDLMQGTDGFRPAQARYSRCGERRWLAWHHDGVRGLTDPGSLRAVDEPRRESQGACQWPSAFQSRGERERESCGCDFGLGKLCGLCGLVEGPRKLVGKMTVLRGAVRRLGPTCGLTGWLAGRWLGGWVAVRLGGCEAGRL